MRLISILIISFLAITSINGQRSDSDFNSIYLSLIQQHVNDHGINYKGITQEELALLNKSLVELPISYLLKEKTLDPLLINVYNYVVIKKVKDYYPIKSVAQVSDFFTKEEQIGDTMINLDDLEKRIVNLAGDPYVHFLLNCGAKSCGDLQYISLSLIHI